MGRTHISAPWWTANLSAVIHGMRVRTVTQTKLCKEKQQILLQSEHDAWTRDKSWCRFFLSALINIKHTLAASPLTLHMLYTPQSPSTSNVCHCQVKQCSTAVVRPCHECSTSKALQLLWTGTGEYWSWPGVKRLSLLCLRERTARDRWRQFKINFIFLECKWQTAISREHLTG